MSAESTTRSVAGLPGSATSPQPARPPEPSRSTSSLAATQTVVAPASTALVRVQWTVAGVLVLLAALTGLRMWMVIGLGRTVRVEGPSMAPAWCGGHYRLACADCGFVFVCDGQSDSAGSQGELAACPNCGFKDNPLRIDNLVAGQQVVIDRWPHAFRGPRRGEVVAAADPNEPDGFVIKRVAGLPGERLAIRGGDLYASDELIRKSLRELHEVRVLVHDNRQQPKRTTGLPPRWKSDRAGSGWHAALGGFRYEPPSRTASNPQFDWLQYQHWLMFAAHSRTRLSPVLDTDSYNQGRPREQNAVTDVLLSCRLQARGSGRFALAAIDGRQRFEAVFDPAARRVMLIMDGRTVVEEDLAVRFAGRAVLVEFGLCDQQVLLSVGGREVFRQPYRRTAGPQPEPLHPLAIGTDGISLDVADLCVWRDIHYLAPGGRPGQWQADEPLPPGSYALLGDNTTVSTDSRQWSASAGGVPGSQILGRVYQPFWLNSDSH